LEEIIEGKTVADIDWDGDADFIIVHTAQQCFPFKILYIWKKSGADF
jgi:hypothetical protein